MKFNLALLPPSKSAAREHILRTYFQVQQWLGFYKDPEDWGWKKSLNGLQPVRNKAQPAPAELLKMIACKCKSNCTGACGCRKAGIQCSVICFHCSGQTCDNSPSFSDCLDDDYIDDEEMDDAELEEVMPMYPQAELRDPSSKRHKM